MSSINSLDNKENQAKTGRSLRCDVCPMLNFGICGALQGESLKDLKEIARRRFIREGDSLFEEGDEASYFYNIVFGAMKLFKTLVDGQQYIVELLYPPAFLGQRLESHHIYEAQAATDVELCYFPRRPFESLVTRHIALRHKVFEMAIRELELSRDHTLILAGKNASERVASFLLMTMNHAPGIGCGMVIENAARIRLPFTRTEMADYLGLTHETVSRQLSVLRKRQIIELQSSRDIIVPDIRSLTEVANSEPISRRSAETADFSFSQRLRNNAA